VTESDATPSKPPWAKRGFIAAAVIVGLIVIAGVLVTVMPSPDSDEGQQPPVTPTVSAPGSTSPAPLPTELPTAAPSDVTWTLVSSLALPVSASAGPAKVTTTASGYAHTPTGALIAGAQLSIRSGITSPVEIAEHTITQQFVAGPDRDRLLENVRLYAGTKIEPGAAGTITGFAFNSYTPDTAVVSLLIRGPGNTSNPTYQVNTTSLQWRDGDWRMVPPPGGVWKSVSRPTTDLTGFVEWGPR